MFRVSGLKLTGSLIFCKRDYFRKKSKPDINKILLEIDRYIDTIDVNSIMDSFTIINREVFISKPGKDDFYYIKKESKLFEDKYIASLFPSNSKTEGLSSSLITAFTNKECPRMRMISTNGRPT